jgi:hypothetical protein
MSITLRYVSNAAAVTAILVAVTGCPRKKVDTADAGLDGATAAIDAAPAGPEATNEADVAHFPDETKLDRVAASTEAHATNVRKSPPNGAVITSLPKGTNVVQLAQHEKFFLISFDDPKDATKRLEGWVIQDAFNATPTPKKPSPPCPAGQTLLLADQDFCGHICKTNKDCPAGQACSGQANIVSADGKIGEAVNTCSFFHLDAGIAAPPDSGAADAGGKAAVADAGGAGAGQTVAGVQQPPGAGNSCPSGFAIMDDKLCHHTCAQPKDCPTGSHCTSKHSTSTPKVGACFTTLN